MPRPVRDGPREACTPSKACLPTGPRLAVPRDFGKRCAGVTVTHTDRTSALMVRHHNGVRVTGVEATIVRLAHLLDGEALEIAFEDARRRKLTSLPATEAYLNGYARRGQRGVATLRALLRGSTPSTRRVRRSR